MNSKGIPTMADNRPNPESSEENIQQPSVSNEAAQALKEVHEAMVILPKKRLGCLGRLAKYVVLFLLLLAAFVYWNFLRTPRLVISKETTYITEPLTSDGKRVDYFAALEREFYPPEMKTDNNGYRMIIRALGKAEDDRYDLQGSKIELDTQARTAQVYEKLGLDPTIKPTMTCVESYDFLRDYGTAKGLDRKQAFTLEEKLWKPWTLDDLPMMKPWLEQVGPVLDLVSQAVRKPVYRFPLIRSDEKATFVEFTVLGELQRTRSFARILLARAYYRIGTGDIDGAIDDVITCARLGRHVERQGTMTTYLVGIATEGMATSVGVAANRESQPTQEQIKRLVDELDAIPPRPDIDRMWLAARYDTLATLQAVAVGDEPLAGLLSLGLNEQKRPGVATNFSVDWNIVMRRVNQFYDDLDKARGLQSPARFALGDLLISSRSRRLSDFLGGLCLPTSQVVREASRHLDCRSNLRRITLAMLLYECEHGTLPPACTVDAAGNPLQSWRALLLPYLGEKELYGKIRLDEPWNSVHNRRFHDTAPAIYQCPSAGLKPGQTTYSVVVGEHTAFQTALGKSLDDMGMNLLLVVEREPATGRNGSGQSVCWMDPASELTESIACKGINRREENGNGMGSTHPGGMIVGLRNGSVRYISQDIKLPLLQGLLDGTADDSQY